MDTCFSMTCSFFRNKSLQSSFILKSIIYNYLNIEYASEKYTVLDFYYSDSLILDLWIGIQIHIISSAVCLVRIIVGITFSSTVYKHKWNYPDNLKVLWHIHPANVKSISLWFMKNMYMDMFLCILYFQHVPNWYLQ